jgi:cytochrome c553
LICDPRIAAAEQPIAEAVPCLPCHGRKNLRDKPKVPSILGQDAHYLAHQIAAFQRDFAPRSGGFLRLERKHPVMSEQAPKIDQADIGKVAEWFSRQACVNARDLDGGPSESLQQPKLATRCFLCHGQQGRSHHAYIPSLAGQRQSYLTRQLLSFRDTRWSDLTRPGQSRTHNMMTRQGQSLNDEQIGELAAYFASLPCR